MRLKALLKQLTPPLVLDAYRRRRRKPIWNGVFTEYRSVPAFGPGFGSTRWVDAAVVATRDHMAQASAIPAGITGQYALLPLLATAVSTARDRKIRILDVGGGVGAAYARLLKAAEAIDVDYHIVELGWACDAGRKLFGHDSRVHFHEALPTELAAVDVVHMDGALQYVDDYRGFLEAIGRYRAEYLLVVDVRCGDHATFASSQQNIPGSAVPCWFFNFKELLDILRGVGYSLVFKAALDVEPSEAAGIGAPPEQPLVAPCALLFTRSHSQAHS